MSLGRWTSPRSRWLGLSSTWSSRAPRGWGGGQSVGVDVNNAPVECVGPGSVVCGASRSLSSSWPASCCVQPYCRMGLQSAEADSSQQGVVDVAAEGTMALGCEKPCPMAFTALVSRGGHSGYVREYCVAMAASRPW